MAKKEQIKKIKTLAFTIALSTTVGLTGCGKGSSNYFSETMRGKNNSTCFDELIGDDYFDKIDELEKYIYISDTLDSMNLKDNTTIDDYSNIYLLSADELESLIFNYKDKDYSDVPKDNIRRILYVQNKLVNSYIRDNGYDIMSTVTLLGLKARVADAAGLSEVEANNFIVMNQKKYEELMDFPFLPIYIGDYNIRGCSDLTNLNDVVYKMQNNAKTVSTTDNDADYNSDRNKILSRAIELIKNVYSHDYKIDRKNRVRRK